MKFYYPLTGMSTRGTRTPRNQDALARLPGTGLLWFYILLKKFRATLGKKVLGLVVVRTDVQPLDCKTIVIRETVGKFLSALVCSLGYIWAGFDEHKQAWHDKLAGTYAYRIK